MLMNVKKNVIRLYLPSFLTSLETCHSANRTPRTTKEPTTSRKSSGMIPEITKTVLVIMADRVVRYMLVYDITSGRTPIESSIGVVSRLPPIPTITESIPTKKEVKEPPK